MFYFMKMRTSFYLPSYLESFSSLVGSQNLKKLYYVHNDMVNEFVILYIFQNTLFMALNMQIL